MDRFMTSLHQLLDQFNEGETEEHQKNVLIRFLLAAFYEDTNEVNTKGRADLVIYNGVKDTSSAGWHISYMTSPQRR